MRKKNYVRKSVCSLLLVIAFGFMSYGQQGQHTVLVNKNGVLTPVIVRDSNVKPRPAVAKTPVANTTKTTSPAPVVITKQKATPTPVVVAKPQPKPVPVVVAKPQPKPVPIVVAKTQPKPISPLFVKPKAVALTKNGKVKKEVPVDYIKRVQAVHNILTRRIPQNVIDSIGDIDHMVLDSIRMEMARRRDKDSISFLKAALANGINDSITLLNINDLVNSAKGEENTQNTGSVNAYCIDLSSQAPMDSVKVNVKSHDTLVATAYSGIDGFCKLQGLKPGEYSLEFAKSSYTPFSDRWVKVTAGNVTYLEMPLSETPRFYIPRFSPQIWALVIVGVVSVFILIYSIIRRLGRVA